MTAGLHYTNNFDSVLVLTYLLKLWYGSFEIKLHVLCSTGLLYLGYSFHCHVQMQPLSTGFSNWKNVAGGNCKVAGALFCHDNGTIVG